MMLNKHGILDWSCMTTFNTFQSVFKSQKVLKTSIRDKVSPHLILHVVMLSLFFEAYWVNACGMKCAKWINLTLGHKWQSQDNVKCYGYIFVKQKHLPCLIPLANICHHKLLVIQYQTKAAETKPLNGLNQAIVHLCLFIKGRFFSNAWSRECAYNRI